MKRGKPYMKSAKLKIGLYKTNKEPKNLGVIRFGKAVPDKTKYVLQDIEYDEKAGKELHRIGMELLAKDKEAVINYVIVKALKNTAKCKK
jgi:hypothetical protein